MKRITILLLFSFIISCSTSSTQEDTVTNPNPDGGGSGTPPPANTGWSIPIEEVLDGGPGKDGIPALVNPNFNTVANTSYVRNTDLVIGFKQGDDVRAYPHAILDWHEIVNDNIDDVSVAITFCPLTGTGIGWSRIINGMETTFGVSGLLYNTNLIPYDRLTDSNWSQILNESVNGTLIGSRADLFPVFETDWQTWKAMYPNSKVLSINTGFSRTYGVSPYGDYNTNNSRFLFPVPKDSRLPNKERVLAIIDGEDAKAYRFQHLDTGGIIRDDFKATDYLIAGNPHFMVAFLMRGEFAALTYSYSFDGTSDILMTDNEGNEWNVFGEAVSGPRTGEVLPAAPALMGFWFSIPAFYKTEIFSN